MRSPSKPPSGPPQVRGTSASDIATRNGVSAWPGTATAAAATASSSAQARTVDLDHHRTVMEPSPLDRLDRSKRRASALGEAEEGGERQVERGGQLGRGVD